MASTVAVMAGREIAGCIAAGILAVTAGGRTRDTAILDGNLSQETRLTFSDDCVKPALTGGLFAVRPAHEVRRNTKTLQLPSVRLTGTLALPERNYRSDRSRGLNKEKFHDQNSSIGDRGSRNSHGRASRGPAVNSAGSKDDKGSVKGTTGASGYAPGQKMQDKGSVKGTTGASGYAPGHADDKSGMRKK